MMVSLLPHAREHTSLCLYAVVHVELLDFIKPNYVTEGVYRSLWTEFEVGPS